ncbi:SIMPL domain-containing protein [Mycolicibacterium sp. P9-64]|uniref:SIMPL domain-containing protein n=1 Tax=Mycolicibacterium sp. P9-64 TaxID=2024612 RepID=UPI0011EFBF1B|nr:SIMPL domain-containing protein [Mycolicibacterium sp. P9-64]KAA0074255.1 SIMPL domain-containing protein [Mycolicibacterium sp. P9-64]
MATEITVRGTFSAFQTPERGTVHASIAYEGPAMEPVYDRVARDFENVKASVTQLKNGDDGPVTWWTAEQLRTWSTRPWNKDGDQRPLVHHASVGIKVKFLDFTALSRWVRQHVVETDGFRVANVEWALTSNRREVLVRQARTEAVRDAVTRAQQYADALGLGKVSPVAIADAGMLGANLHPQSGDGPAYLRAASAPSGGGGADVELVPQDIEVSAAVDGRFVVHGA